MVIDKMIPGRIYERRRHTAEREMNRIRAKMRSSQTLFFKNMLWLLKVSVYIKLCVFIYCYLFDYLADALIKAYQMTSSKASVAPKL
ncbi:unnamed protein product [Larinioides sclopetarius]|uniref:Uncharacterized protein n=1 Tax=Larinioides sclopetarius TaxID=280406 RepID=A0AAV1Z1N4_9ARAC